MCQVDWIIKFLLQHPDAIALIIPPFFSQLCGSKADVRCSVVA
jgi:hypothetical protein